MESLELDRIIFLLSDENYITEFRTYKRSLQRLRVRLRNNCLTADLNHVKSLIKRLEANFPIALFQHYQTKLPRRRSFYTFKYRLSQFISELDKIIRKATLVYGTSQPHFRVGHLVQHYIVVRACLARLIFCYKALLVYSVDLYLSLSTATARSQKDQKKVLTSDEATNILLKHNCKPKPQSDDEPLEVIEQNPSKRIKLDDSIGELIDRETMRPVRACRKR